MAKPRFDSEPCNNDISMYYHPVGMFNGMYGL